MNHVAEQKVVFTVLELAERWQCSSDVIYDMLKRGDLKGFKLGGAWRVARVVAERYELGEG